MSAPAIPICHHNGDEKVHRVARSVHARRRDLRRERPAWSAGSGNHHCGMEQKVARRSLRLVSRWCRKDLATTLC